MKTIGIKLADGSFYPVLKEGSACEKVLELTTAHNNQTKVMVDLYRSATNSMDDAEYVDSLQIENLNAHPNGEPDIKFTVSLDENNELSAKIVDSETGAQSDTLITLISRTIEERLYTDEYNISEIENEKDDKKINAAGIAVGAAAGAGLLKAAEALREKQKQGEEDGATDQEIQLEDEIPEDIEPTAVEETSISEEELSLPDEIDVPKEEDDIEQETVFEQEVEVNEDSEQDDFDMPAFTETPEDIVKDENEDIFSDIEIAEPNEDADVVTEEPSEKPLEEIDTIDDTTNINFDLPDFEDEVQNEQEKNDDLPDMDFDFPGEPEAPTEFTESNVEETQEDNSEADIDFDIPDTYTSTDTDIDTGISTETQINTDTETNTETESDIDTTIIEQDTNDLDDVFDSIDDSSVDESSEEDLNLDITDTIESNKETGGISFTGLYDKETELGEASNHEEEEVSKKTRTPVIICVICAIICILATLSVLYIRHNILPKKNAEKVDETPVEVVAEEPKQEIPPVEQEPEYEESVPETLEDDIVVIENVEDVVPEQPAVVEEPKDITYKIKWGDTLWDIADTYYKNPWRYHYIARYNGIKDPDYIISGTYIKIPAK